MLFLFMLALVHVPLEKDAFPRSFGLAPVPAEFCIYIVDDGSYWVMALVLYTDRVGDRS